MPNHLSSYPLFLNDSPIGEDKFKGKSHEKISDQVIFYIKGNKEESKRVIGIEGEWGSGKSNVIKLIKNKSGNEEFHFFNFDAWGHQEDLTRRSFLEELVEDLIEEKKIPNSWNKKLKEELATNVFTNVKEIPEVNIKLAVFVLCLAGFTLLKDITHWIRHIINTPDPQFFDTLFPIFFIIILFIIFFDPFKNKNYLSEAFVFFKGDKIVTNRHETITRLEPSVKEFKDILYKVITSIDSKITLIIVIDNMDRLAKEKVKEIWSSIHTFFSETHSRKIRPWVIIPFDHAHMEETFEGENEAQNYLQKTFSIVFRVTPPVLSDWRIFLDEKYFEAFGEYPKSNEHIANIFDFLHANTTIKPREIIYYLNDIVSLKRIWADSIPLKYIALFSLKKNEISKNPYEYILNKTFLKGVQNLFINDQKVQTYISALFFNVEISKADEVLLKRNIDKAFFGEGNFLSLISHPAFYPILESSYHSLNFDLSKTIEAFEEVSPLSDQPEKISFYWEDLSKKFTELDQTSYGSNEKYFYILFKHLTKVSLQKELLARNLEFIVNVHDQVEQAKIFKGSEYAIKIDALDDFIKKHSDINIFEMLPFQEFISKDYIDFAISCKQNYMEYNVFTDMNILEKYLIETIYQLSEREILFIQMSSKNIEYNALKDFALSSLKSINKNDSEVNTKTNVLLNVYKAIEHIKPYRNLIPFAKATELLDNSPLQEANYDLLFIILSYKELLVTSTKGTHVMDLGAATASDMHDRLSKNYLTYSDMIFISIEYPVTLIADIVRRQTLRTEDNISIDLNYTISNYSKIKKNIFNSNNEYLEKFLFRIAEKFDSQNLFLNQSNFEQIIPLEFIEDVLAVNVVGKEFILEKSIEFLSEATAEKWADNFEHSSSSYLIQLFVLLKKDNQLDNLHFSNAFHAYQHFIKAIAKNGSPPTDFHNWNFIFDFFQPQLQPTYEEVRQILLFDRGELTDADLIFFNYGLFKSKVLERSEVRKDITRRILLPSIKRIDVFEISIIPNEESVIKIINESSKELKQEIEQELRQSVELDQSSNLHISKFIDKVFDKK